MQVINERYKNRQVINRQVINKHTFSKKECKYGQDCRNWKGIERSVKTTSVIGQPKTKDDVIIICVCKFNHTRDHFMHWKKKTLDQIEYEAIEELKLIEHYKLEKEHKRLENEKAAAKFEGMWYDDLNRFGKLWRFDYIIYSINNVKIFPMDLARVIRLYCFDANLVYNPFASIGDSNIACIKPSVIVDIVEDNNRSAILSYNKFNSPLLNDNKSKPLNDNKIDPILKFVNDHGVKMYKIKDIKDCNVNTKCKSNIIYLNYHSYSLNNSDKLKCIKCSSDYKPSQFHSHIFYNLADSLIVIICDRCLKSIYITCHDKFACPFRISNGENKKTSSNTEDDKDTKGNSNDGKGKDGKGNNSNDGKGNVEEVKTNDKKDYNEIDNNTEHKQENKIRDNCHECNQIDKFQLLHYSFFTSKSKWLYFGKVGTYKNENVYLGNVHGDIKHSVKDISYNLIDNVENTKQLITGSTRTQSVTESTRTQSVTGSIIKIYNTMGLDIVLTILLTILLIEVIIILIILIYK